MRYAEFLEKESFSKEELLACAKANLVTDSPGEGIAPLPAPPFLMFDRITKLEKKGQTGSIVAEQDIKSDAWYFQCHFQGDPVQPGCLGVDAVWQLIGFYCNSAGAIGSGRALGSHEIIFDGQIRPYNKVVRYEVDIRRFSILKENGSAIAIGHGRVYVDDEKIYEIKNAKVGVFKDIAYHDYPNSKSKFSRGGVINGSI